MGEAASDFSALLMSHPETNSVELAKATQFVVTVGVLESNDA